jgi:hypothetical protein
VSILSGTLLHAAQSEPLVLESKIPLADVKGRIDHLAVDAARQRLYGAELGNNSVGVVDLRSQHPAREIARLCSRAWVLARPIHDNRDDRPGSEGQYADRCDRVRGTDQVGDDAGQECTNRVTHVAPESIDA